jgi:AcrR family transcriptional regulator
MENSMQNLKTPAVTGGPRSAETRQRILGAARQLFATVGFEHCTVRSVAAEAGIHASLVMRYFGSKEGLFASAMKFDLQLPSLKEIPQADRGRTLVAHLLKRWGGVDASSELPALVRLSITHPEAKERLFAVFAEQVAPMIRSVVPARLAKTATALIATQTMGLALSRYVLEIPAIVSLPEKVLIEAIGNTIQTYLNG